jgi:hypothetical protein
MIESWSDQLCAENCDTMVVSTFQLLHLVSHLVLHLAGDFGWLAAGSQLPVRRLIFK